MMAKNNWGVFGFWVCLLSFLICAGVGSPARSDKETRERFYGVMVNSTAPESNDTFAKMFDRVLEKEFSENDQPEGFCIALFILCFWLDGVVKVSNFLLFAGK